jgi:hypothetical protein
LRLEKLLLRLEVVDLVLLGVYDNLRLALIAQKLVLELQFVVLEVVVERVLKLVLNIIDCFLLLMVQILNYLLVSLCHFIDLGLKCLIIILKLSYSSLGLNKVLLKSVHLIRLFEQILVLGLRISKAIV